MEETSDVSRLVRDSASGSAEAWSELVRRYAPLVMSVIRSYRLSPADAQDVSQTVWLRLVEHLSGCASRKRCRAGCPRPRSANAPGRSASCAGCCRLTRRKTGP